MLDEAHQSSFSIHPGSVKMYKDLKPMYWWPGMKVAITDYVSRCLTCQKVKVEHQAPTVRKNMSSDILAELYIREVIRLQGVLISIVSDRDPKFTSQFWKSLQKALGTRVNLSMAFHLQTDGQSERVIRILEDMLRACLIDFGRNWEKNIPLVEFAYNNSYQTSIQMAPFEALYGQRCRTPICWSKLGENKVLGPQMIQDTEKQFQIIHDRLIQAFDRKKAYADTKRFGKKGKLSPRYIGLFEVLEKVGPVAYPITLPPEFDKIHNVFHVSMLRKYRSDPSHVLEPEEVELNPDLT
ncbi:hypothetical protein V6N11_049747 [Hibiscus sabdariffa]|uniref:Integrase catalytic domain-containing protein n=1 Tax=Hibiscus sabdariffa TaxID=183260 RepID=A0ABR2T8D7_9ROSI